LRKISREKGKFEQSGLNFTCERYRSSSERRSDADEVENGHKEGERGRKKGEERPKAPVVIYYADPRGKEQLKLLKSQRKKSSTKSLRRAQLAKNSDEIEII